MTDGFASNRLYNFVDRPRVQGMGCDVELKWQHKADVCTVDFRSFMPPAAAVDQ